LKLSRPPPGRFRFGVATNKLVAKVGATCAKPTGWSWSQPGEEAAFLAQLEIRRLWGIGPKDAIDCTAWACRTIGELGGAAG